MYNVFIITRCTDLSCRKSATLVFDTIRVGFPAYKIVCFYLGDFTEVKNEIVDRCAKLNIELKDSPIFLYNNQVIEYLVQSQDDPFIVVDSDVVFHKNLGWYKPTKNIAGRYIPKYYEDFVKAVSEERLHTSLMYFSNIPELRKQIEESFVQKCNGSFTPYNVFSPVVVKSNGQSIFYDSCSILYGAIGGEAFDKNVLDCYDHLFAGSFYKELKRPDLDRVFDSVFADASNIKDIYRSQNKYWYSNVYKEIEITFSMLLSSEAKQFLSNYVNYLELIDDAIDNDDPTLVDIITEKALKLFSSNYWTKNSIYLRLIEQITHVLYFNSVAWENSPVAWKRRDAKALSHCGYLMPIAIFLHETGNMTLAKDIALKLMERSHLGHMEDLTKEEYVA